MNHDHHAQQQQQQGGDHGRQRPRRRRNQQQRHVVLFICIVTVFTLAFRNIQNSTTIINQTSSNNNDELTTTNHDIPIVSRTTNSNIQAENEQSALMTAAAAQDSKPILTTTTTTVREQPYLDTTQQQQRQIESEEESIFIIGAGRGTTGTHLIFETTCHLGIPSHHWVLGCIPPQPSDTNTTSTATTGIPQIYIDAQRPHQELRGMIHKLKRCLSKRIDTHKCGNIVEWKRQALYWLKELVNNPIFHAIHDTPYPYFIPELLRLSNMYHKHTILLLSERDPTSFAIRRLSQSDKRADPMCLSIKSKIDPITLKGGGFDLLGCIDDALLNVTTHNSSTNLDMSDIFTTFDHIANITKDPITKQPIINNMEGQQLITNEMTYYQDVLRNASYYTLNMFIRPNRTSKEMVTEELLKKIPVLRKWKQKHEMAAHHVHWGRNKMRGQ